METLCRCNNCRAEVVLKHGEAIRVNGTEVRVYFDSRKLTGQCPKCKRRYEYCVPGGAVSPS